MQNTPYRRILSDWSKRIPRQPDGNAIYLHCTGGVRCAKHDEGKWHVEPIFDGSGPVAKGFMKRQALQAFLHEHGFRPIAFQHLGWHQGNYHSTWTAILSGRDNHMQGPADFWGHIRGNMSDARTSPHLELMSNPTPERLANILDPIDDVERLVESISLSFRNIDIAVEKIAEFYNENLVNIMSSADLHGKLVSSSLDNNLFAHVHSFFMHLGAARDYLATLIAQRLGKKSKRVDSMARLIPTLSKYDSESEPLVKMLVSRRCLEAKSSPGWKLKESGWLEEVTLLRNVFIHRRPYGSKFLEQMGRCKSVDTNFGIYKYFRSVIHPDGTEYDLLDLIAYHYGYASNLFLEAAHTSGYDTKMMNVTDRDIVGLEIN